MIKQKNHSNYLCLLFMLSILSCGLDAENLMRYVSFPEKFVFKDFVSKRDFGGIDAPYFVSFKCDADCSSWLVKENALRKIDGMLDEILDNWKILIAQLEGIKKWEIGDTDSWGPLYTNIRNNSGTDVTGDHLLLMRNNGDKTYIILMRINS